MTAPSASWPRKSASRSSAPIRALPATRTASPTATRCAPNSPPSSASTRPNRSAIGCWRQVYPAGPVQKIDQALTNPHTLHRGDIIEKDWYKGCLPDPARSDQAEPAADTAEVQPAHSRGARRIRLFQRGDRGAGCQGRGLRRPTQALNVVAPANAGAHTPRLYVWALRQSPFCNHAFLWLWAPAFAGATRQIASISLRLFSGFPPPTLPQYHAFAYTVIRTSSGAVIARNEGDDPNPGGIPWHFDNSAQRRQ